MRKKVLSIGILLFLLAANYRTFASQQDSSTQTSAQLRKITSVEPLTKNVERYQKFELTIDLDATVANPYDPDEIRLDAVFTAPSGKTMTVPGFYFRDFNFELTDTAEEMSPTDTWSWRVRFTPTESGEWQYQVKFSAGKETLSSETFTVTVKDSNRRGFIRISPNDPRYLSFDDGSPYFAVGENMGWYNEGKMADYKQWLDAMVEAKGNTIRVWLASWAFGFEWTDTGLGNYDARQDRAYRLDRLFDMLDERGIYVMLSLINHGRFSETTNSEWAANPYNAANGGPLRQPVEFATNEEAVRLWKQQLRYIVARWGYSTQLMAWEWWNEVNWTPLAEPALLSKWIQDSAETLQALDPYQHLVTHSGSVLEDDEIWSLPSISFTQEHIYQARNWAFNLNEKIPQWIEKYNKPFLLGEFGYVDEPEFDPHAIRLHIGLWTAPMSGAFGGGMFWWWDKYVHPNNLYPQFTALANFFEGEDLSARNLRKADAKFAEHKQAYIFGRQSDNYALLWIVSQRYTDAYYLQLYQKNLLAEAKDPTQVKFPDIEGAVVNINGLTDGEYTVEWWDSHTGKIIKTGRITVTDGTGSIELPTFSTDLAVKVRSAN